MKPSFKSKPVIKTVIFVFCCALVISFFLLSKHFLPRAVCYSVSSSNGGKIPAVPQNDENLKENISEIHSNGPFIITVIEDGIYVTLEKKAVYKVKLSLSELTDKDRHSLYEGIEITGKQNLAEIVSLMES